MDIRFLRIKLKFVKVIINNILLLLFSNVSSQEFLGYFTENLILIDILENLMNSPNSPYSNQLMILTSWVVTFNELKVL